MLAAHLILLQCRPALPIQRQHQLAVRLFAPGFQCDLPPAVVLRPLILTTSHVGGRESLQGCQRLLVSLLLLYQSPLLQIWTVQQQQPGQEIAAV